MCEPSRDRPVGVPRAEKDVGSTCTLCGHRGPVEHSCPAVELCEHENPVGWCPECRPDVPEWTI